MSDLAAIIGNGKVALVTGAARGIGLGISAWLIAEGWQVVLVDQDRERGAKIAEALGDKAWFIALDVSQESQVAQTVAEVLGQFGHGLGDGQAVVPVLGHEAQGCIAQQGVVVMQEKRRGAVGHPDLADGFGNARQMRPQADLFAHPRAGFPAHQRMQAAGEHAFGFLRVKRMQPFGDDQPQHPVAQKFQALVGVMAVGAGVGQGAAQKDRIGKTVIQSFFQSGQGFQRGQSVISPTSAAANSGW